MNLRQLVGESGSGKSTLLNCIGALDDPTSGKVYLNDQDLFSMKEQQRTVFRRRNIGFVFQSFQLIPELNVEQNIMFPLLLDYQKPDKKSVDEILDMLGLTDRRGHLPSQLSGGQQQRVAHRQGAYNKAYVDFGGRANWKSGQQSQPRCHGSFDHRLKTV